MLQVVTIVLSVAAFGVSLLNLLVNRASRFQAHVNLLIQLRREWVQLQPSWRVCLALVRGLDDYYAGLSPKEIAELSSKISFINGYSSSHQLQDLPRSLDSQLAVAAELRQDVLTVRDFLGLCASSLMSGDLSSRELYAFLGPEVARHGRVVRSLVFGARTHGLSGQAFPSGGQGTHKKVLAMQDLLWAELARNGDLYLHQILECARHKQKTGSGLKCRRRAVRLIFKDSGVRGWWRALKGAWLLLYAEYVPRPCKEDLEDGDSFSLADSLGLAPFYGNRRKRLKAFIVSIPSVFGRSARRLGRDLVP